MLLASMDPENIKKNRHCSLLYILLVLHISWKLIYLFFCYVANRHIFPRKNRKRNHICNGLSRTSPKCSRWFLVPTYPATFMKSVQAFSCNMSNRQTNQQIGMKTQPLPLKHNLRLSADVKIIVNGYLTGIWRTLWTNTRCLLWVAVLPRSVPKQTQLRERNTLYSYCGRVADNTKYEPQLRLGWQKLYMWRNVLYDQWSNGVHLYMYFHSRVSIWLLKDLYYFHVEKLCHF